MCYLRKANIELTADLCKCGASTYTFDSYPPWCELPQAGQIVIYNWNYPVPQCTLEDLITITHEEINETIAIIGVFDSYTRYTPVE
jgi:hypothetical protein